jgi:hypothetical protein
MYGNQCTVSSIDNSLSSFATQLRDLMSQLSNFNEYIGTIGTAGLTSLPAGTAPAAYTDEDAEAITALAGNWDTLAQIANGIAVGMSLPFDFIADGTPTWAGQ